MGYKLVDMLETPKEQEKAYPLAMPVEAPKPSYPYGLHITLDEEVMAKLGITELPEIDEVIHLFALAKVDRVNSSATDQGEQKCCGLQIIMLALEDEDEENVSVAERLYDNEE